MRRRQKHLAVTITANTTTSGLHFLVDSTGIKMLSEDECKTERHDSDYRRQWRKVNLGIDAATLEIPAIGVIDNATGDAPILPRLVDQSSADESSRASVAMALTPSKLAMKPLLNVLHRPSFQHAKRQALERPATG